MSETHLTLAIVRVEVRMRVERGRGLRGKEEEPLVADQLSEHVLLLVVVHRGYALYVVQD
jgi:hypothetical protein